MTRQPFGVVLIVSLLLGAGLLGIAAAWAAWPRTANTSPLATILSLVWTGTQLVAAVHTWRGGPFAAPAFLAAAGFLLPLLFFVLPGAGLVLIAPFAVAGLLSVAGFRYLSRPRVPAP